MHYLDHNATSPLRPEANAAMARALAIGGNPSSVHGRGRVARAIVEEARGHVASLAGGRAQDVIFTASGTEANSLALWGALSGAAEAGERITRLFVSAIEHDSILANAAAVVERGAGARLTVVPVTGDGVIDLDALRSGLREGKGRALIAVMGANNETGVIQPIHLVGSMAKECEALLLVDAVQAAGKTDMDFAVADYLSLSAHKIGGPQGVGALVVKDDAPFAPQLLGGGQERGLRAGTENVSGIAGFGAAAEVLAQDAGVRQRVTGLRDMFEIGLCEIAPTVTIFGASAPRLPNTCNFAFSGVIAETALMALDLDGLMVSTGAACSSGKVRPSHVLEAMGVSGDQARCALRASFGWNSTEDDVAVAIGSLALLVGRVRAREAA
jgi:cysteine desulfurase